jgi:hypothetical protein
MSGGIYSRHGGPLSTAALDKDNVKRSLFVTAPFSHAEKKAGAFVSDETSPVSVSQREQEQNCGQKFMAVTIALVTGIRTV